jgi:hypothetical protein
MKTVVSEARVKVKIKKVLDNYRSYIYYYMPVPGGYGRSTLDYLGFCCGLGFAIEAKSSVGNPTERQLAIMQQITAVHVPVFIVRDDASLAQLDQWLNTVTTKWRGRHEPNNAA